MVIYDVINKKQLFRVSAVCNVIAVIFFLTPITLAQTFLITSWPQDPDYVRQPQLKRVHAEEAWRETNGSVLQRDVVVALLDTGVDVAHPDLQGAIWTNSDEVPNDGIDNDNNSYVDDVNGWDFIESSPDIRPKAPAVFIYEAVHHGTVVAGIIAARANGIGIIGADHAVKIMPLRILDASGTGNTILLAQAIDYAVDNGADVINLSLVGDTNDERLTKSIERAYNNGVAVVAASGNQDSGGLNLDVTPHYPICEARGINRVIGVAAIDENNNRAVFSNYGSTCIDVSAPGTGFYSTVYTVPGDDRFAAQYAGGWNGTSVAAPLVSATLALITHVAPNISVQQAYDAILGSVQPFDPTTAKVRELGAGILDMQGAVARAVTVSRKKPIYIVVASASGATPAVTVRDVTGVAIAQFFAYDKRFTGGVQTAIGDVTGDGVLDIVTVPLSGGGPHVRIFSLQGELEGQFMAYERYYGGLSLAVGDLDADGVDEIVVAPARGGGPHVRAFKASGSLFSEFFAYDKRFTGGVMVAVADLDGNRSAKIVTAPASAGGPHIRIFSGQGNLQSQFMAFDPSYRGGLSIAAGDVNGDGAMELIAGQIVKQNIQVRIFNRGFEEINRFLLYPAVDDRESLSHVAVVDITGDGRDDIISYSLSGITPVRVHDYYGNVLSTLTIPVETSRRKNDVYRIAIAR